jgi:hypothetical protein
MREKSIKRKEEQDGRGRTRGGIEEIEKSETNVTWEKQPFVFII